MKTNKEFDCVEMMRDIRNQIDEKIKDMTNSEIIEFINIDNKEFEKKYINKQEFREVA